MKPAELLLNHYDRLAGSEPRFAQVSEGSEPSFYAAIYRGFPSPGAQTGFTVGLSHFHPPGGGHKELTISMHDTHDSWALACAFTAYQLRERTTFGEGETIDFRAQIAPSSEMSAFVVTRPFHLPPADCVVDLEIRRIEIAQLIPLYSREREWLRAGGTLKTLLGAFSQEDLMNPKREKFAGA